MTTRAILLSAAAALAGCTTLTEPDGAPRKETVYAVTAANRLVSFNAGQPRRLLSDRPLAGLRAGETLLGIDYRVARGQLFGLGSSGRLYRIDTASGTVSAVGTVSPAMAVDGREAGFDFNPTVDRIRVVFDACQNLRLHPDTGAVIDGDAAKEGVQGDAALAYADGDANAGAVPRIVAAAYTYNKDNEKITTNFAIDAARGLLVTQGTREGRTPAVSPNSGKLYTVGPLGVGRFERAAFDIADVSGAAFVALTAAGAKASTWHLVDLETGAATLIGTIGGDAVRGVAIEP